MQRVNVWTILRQRAVEAKLLNMPEKKIDVFLCTNNIKGYGDSIGM